MMDCHAWEEKLAREKHVNDYYPDIERFHQNEIMKFFDSLNTDYLVERKGRLSRVSSKGEALSYIQGVRDSFKSCLGELQGLRTVNAKVVGTIEKDAYFIDRVLIESLPGYYLTSNFYYPRHSEEKCPVILFLLGHSSNGKAYPLYLSFCLEAVLNGFCVLAFDPVGQGERKMYDAEDSEAFAAQSPDAVHYLLGQQARLIGESITAYMMWDNIKALDYLLSRKEADPGAVTVVGNSGGGQMASFMGAYDDRVHAVVSSCYITELKSMIYHIGAQECEQSLQDFMKTGLGLADLVIAASPKPYFIGSSLMDFFPIDGTRDAYIDARKIYRLLEKEENLEICIAPKPHGFWWDSREKALRFLCRHFGKQFIEDKGIGYDNLPSEQELLCLDKGDVNCFNTTTLQEIFCDKAAKIYPNAPSNVNETGFEGYCKKVRSDLSKVLCIDHDSVKADIDKVAVSYNKNSNIKMTDFSFYPEEYMKIYGSLFEREQGVKPNVLLHVGALGIPDEQLGRFLEEFPAVFSVEPRGTGRGTVEPGCFFYPPAHFENEEGSYNCNAAMLGRNVAGMRVLDVLGAVKLLGSIKGYENCTITLSGDGENALTALYAAVALGGRDVRLSNLLCSFRSIIGSRMYMWSASVFVHDILRYLDIPDLLAVLASNDVRIDGFLDSMKRQYEK